MFSLSRFLPRSQDVCFVRCLEGVVYGFVAKHVVNGCQCWRLSMYNAKTCLEDEFNSV